MGRIIIKIRHKTISTKVIHTHIMVLVETPNRKYTFKNKMQW